MFLVQEWQDKKQGLIHHFKGIKSFAKHIDDTIVFEVEEIFVFPKDFARTDAIDNLMASYNFAQTHSAIADLTQYVEAFSPDELERLLEIALSNNQVGGILSDEDVQSFYTKVRSKMPWAGNAMADRFDVDFGDLYNVPF